MVASYTSKYMVVSPASPWLARLNIWYTSRCVVSILCTNEKKIRNGWKEKGMQVVYSSKWEVEAQPRKEDWQVLVEAAALHGKSYIALAHGGTYCSGGCCQQRCECWCGWKKLLRKIFQKN